MAQSEAYERHPQHTLEFDAERVALRILIGDEQIVDTRSGLQLKEGRYPVVVYVPREDVAMDRLARSEHSTHCPFKGDASYFDYVGAPGQESIEQIGWSYEDPFDQMLELKGHLAFYADRVTIETNAG
jgi:uncharacterized protein (DUF427 family)